MTRKKTKFCLSWPNKTFKMSGRLLNIGILLTGQNDYAILKFDFPAQLTFLPDVTSFSLDDLDTQKVPGVAECSPPPLTRTE